MANSYMKAHKQFIRPRTEVETEDIVLGLLQSVTELQPAHKADLSAIDWPLAAAMHHKRTAQMVTPQ